MDMTSMKKEAAKEALEDLIKEVLGMEGRMIKGDDEEECEEMEMPEAVAEAASGEPEMPGMTEEELEEKKAYMTGAKKPVVKKSMMVVLGGPAPKSSSAQGPKPSMASMFKKKPKYG